MAKAYGVSSPFRDFKTTQVNIIKEEIFKLKPSVGNKIVILKNIDVIPKYVLREISF